VQLLAAGLGGGGMATMVNAVAKRRSRRVDAAGRFSDSNLKWVEQFQEETREARQDATEARREAAEARREATNAHREMRAVREEAEALAGRLAALIRLIHDPYMSLDRLRAMVPAPPAGANGDEP
jgi:chromosome segregation ATPase